MRDMPGQNVGIFTNPSADSHIIDCVNDQGSSIANVKSKSFLKICLTYILLFVDLFVCRVEWPQYRFSEKEHYHKLDFQWLQRWCRIQVISNLIQIECAKVRRTNDELIPNSVLCNEGHLMQWTELYFGWNKNLLSFKFCRNQIWQPAEKLPSSYSPSLPSWLLF